MVVDSKGLPQEAGLPGRSRLMEDLGFRIYSAAVPELELS